MLCDIIKYHCCLNVWSLWLKQNLNCLWYFSLQVMLIDAKFSSSQRKPCFPLSTKWRSFQKKKLEALRWNISTSNWFYGFICPTWVNFRDRKTAVKEVKDWLSRLHCLVVGPGMGRNPTIIENVKVNLWYHLMWSFISVLWFWYQERVFAVGCRLSELCW